MKRWTIICGLASGLLLGSPLKAECGSLPAKPMIEFHASDNAVRIDGIALGHAAIRVRAVMSILRVSDAGRMSTAQSRTIDLVPGAREIVATTGVSLGPNARLIVTLTLEADGEEIGRAERTLTSN